MIRIGICDDSSAFLNQIETIIKSWQERPQNVITELYTDGDALILAHSQNPFDIILLDIVMPLINGIDTARELRERDKNVKLVFLTSSAEYAVESYTVKANNYLLKPIEPIKLLDCLAELIAEVLSASKALTIRGLNASYKIPLSNIEYVESQYKHIIFHTNENKTITSAEPLYAYEDTLLLKDGFFKCHRSYIVNIHRINSFSASEIVMLSGNRIPISRSNQKIF